LICLVKVIKLRPETVHYQGSAFLENIQCLDLKDVYIPQMALIRVLEQEVRCISELRNDVPLSIWRDFLWKLSICRTWSAEDVTLPGWFLSLSNEA